MPTAPPWACPFLVLAASVAKDRQFPFDGRIANPRIKENKTVNFLRDRVRLWREGDYPQITAHAGRPNSWVAWRPRDNSRGSQLPINSERAPDSKK